LKKSRISQEVIFDERLWTLVLTGEEKLNYSKTGGDLAVTDY
jgi:hypothetical protein